MHLVGLVHFGRVGVSTSRFRAKHGQLVEWLRWASTMLGGMGSIPANSKLFFASLNLLNVTFNAFNACNRCFKVFAIVLIRFNVVCD